MIKNIFLPEQFGSYYIFGKRIVGIYVSKLAVNATLCYARGNTTTIEQCIEIPLDGLDGTDTTERTTQALKQLATHFNASYEIHTALASSLVVFKELRIPFSSYEKIALIVPFEVEPLLPFTLADAVVDFIITHIDKDTHHAQILVAAVQRVHITQHLEMLAQAGINPDRISIDLFDLYSLYNAIPTHAIHQTSSAFITIGLQETHIAYLDTGQLRFIRTIQKGVLTLAKQVADTLGITPAQAMEHVMRFGVQDTDWTEYTQAIKQALNSFWDGIQFTLTSFATQANSQQPIQLLQLLGVAATLKGIIPYSQEYTKMTIELFDAHAIGTIPHVAIKSGLTLGANNILSTAIALPTQTTLLFNLRKYEFAITNPIELYKQIGVMVTLSILVIVSLLIYSHIQLGVLHAEVDASEQEAIQLLKDRFKGIENEGGTLDEMLDSAEEVLKKDKKTWSVFSGQSRISYLRYLVELTTVLDTEAIGLVLDKITFTENMMILKGQVKDYDALTLMKQELRQSKLFKEIERENNPQFEALKITLAHGSTRE